MQPVNRGVIADQVLADMQRIIKVHPSAIDVILCESVLVTNKTSGAESLDYEDQDIDWKEPVTIKAIEVTKEMAPQVMKNLGIGPSGEYDEPILMLLEKTAPEQSLILTMELNADGQIAEKVMSIIEATGIGRDGRGGSIYQLVPFRGADDDVAQEIEEQKELITGEPSVPPLVDTDEYVWGEK